MVVGCWLLKEKSGRAKTTKKKAALVIEALY
jgi:hypothetical protein